MYVARLLQLISIQLILISGLRPTSTVLQSKLRVRQVRLQNAATIYTDDVGVENALQGLFHRQAAQGVVYGSNDEKISKLYQRPSLKERKVVEYACALKPGVPLEVIIDGKLRMANYIGVKGDKSINIRLSNGIEKIIDIAQVISVWDSLDEDNIPRDENSWALVFNEALELMRIMSPRKSDLEEFYKLVVNTQSKRVSIDSIDLCVYIFQEKRFRAWMRMSDNIEQLRVNVPTAAQRYVSALLLFSDNQHFKRAPSQRAWPEDTLDEEDSLIQTNAKELLQTTDTYVIEGGYLALPQSLSSFRQCESFVEYYQIRCEQTSKETEIPRTACITRILRLLELYSLQPENTSSPQLLKMILKKLKKDISPTGARSILIDMGLNSAEYAPRSTLMDVKRAVAAVMNDPTTRAQVSEEISSLKYLTGLTPWTAEVLAASKQLQEHILSRRRKIAEYPVAKMGKRGFEGRSDLRAQATEHPVFCVDTKFATFFDDAFSLSPETGEIFVHIADVRQYLREFPMLQEVARERLQSQFLPTGPVHMFPPAALETLGLSKHAPNEVITVAISVDRETGAILGHRVFPAIIPAVTALTVEEVNLILDHRARPAPQKKSRLLQLLKHGKEEEENDARSALVGYSAATVKDLSLLDELCEKICLQLPWLSSKDQTRSQEFKVTVNKRGVSTTLRDREYDGAFRMLNTILSLYSNSSQQFCTQTHQLPVPILWENRDRVFTDIVRRFATYPLRNYISLLQQQQLRAALKMDLPLEVRDCAKAVAYQNNKRKEISRILNQGREVLAYDAFEQFVRSKVQIDNNDEAAHARELEEANIQLKAKAVGTGGNILVLPFNVKGYVSETLQKNQIVTVRLKKLIPNMKTAAFELVE